MSIPAEKGEPPPEDKRVRCHRTLYRKEVGLVMDILGNFASTRRTDPFSDRSRADELQEVLEEIDMIWRHCDTSTQLVLSESAISVDGALGLLCEFVYRIARDVTHKVYSHFSKSILLIASFLENCVRVNRRAQEKLLNSGMLFGQVALLENWVPLLDEMDLSPNLILGLSVLHQCFMTSSMSLFYAFFDKDWCQILKPLTNSTNQEIRMLAKFVASDIHFALSSEEQCIIELTDEDTDFLVCHLAMATASDQLESSCNGFHKPISVMELIVTLENLVAHSKNCAKVVEQPTIVPTLAALLLSLETRQKTSVCKLLILLVGSSSFDSVWSEDDKMLLVDSLGQLKRSQDVALLTLSISLLCLLQKEGNQAFTSPLLEAILKLNTTLSEKLELDPVKGSSSCELSVIYLNDLLKMMIVLAECTYSEDVLGILSYCNITGTLESLYHFIAIIFNRIESLNDSVFPCLPLILMLLLRWSSKCKEARCCIMKQGHLNLHTYQLRILATHGSTWFTNFLVQVNLGIILSCVQESQFLASYQDVYWSAVLTPWLKSSQEDTRIATFLIGSSILYLFEEEDPAMFVLRKEDSEKCISLFTAAAESSHLSAVLCNNLLTVSVQTLLKALKYLFVTHNHLFKSQRVFNAVVTLLLNGGVPEIQAACDFVVTMEDWPPLNDMVKDCELPLLEILEQVEESEDCELKTSAKNALNVVQGYSNQDVSSATDVCRGFMRDAVKIVQSISHNFKMAKDSQWELLDQYITQYLSVYLKSDSKAKLMMTDDISATRSIVRALCRFVSMLIEYITTSSDTKRIQLQCLGVIVSGLASWSDWSRKIRCQIQRTPVIVHLINLVSFLSSISDEEISISQLVLTSAIVISNCSSEKDFGLLYVPPGTIDWASILSSWMESPYAPLRFSAKSIAGNIIHALDDDMLFLLDLTNAEVELLAEMVSQCTFSESLTASGFGCQFRAKELIDLVSSLTVSPHNFSEIILLRALPLSLLQLLRKGGSHVKKSTCRLLLQLSCSYNIRKEMNDLRVKEALLEEMSEESNDPCFLFLGKCLRLALDNAGTHSTTRHICYEFDDVNALVDLFMEMVEVLVTEISTVLLKFEGRKVHLSAKSSSHIRMMELIEEVHLFWSRCSLSVQDVITNTLTSNHPQALQVLHKFLFKAMRALGNSEDDLIGPCLVKVLLCFQGWAQTSRHLCERILEEGFFFDYVTTRFSSMRNNNFENFIVSTMMNIILHCVQIPAISVYYSAINSSKLLCGFATSPLQELRVITKCVAGYVALSLDDQMLSVLHFSEEDAQALVNCFRRAANSDYHLAKFQGGFYKLSLLLIMKAIDHLLIQQTEINTLKHYLVELVDVLGANFFQPLVAVMKHGTTSEVNVACGLLWSLLDVENIRVKVQLKSEIIYQEMMKLNQKHCSAPELEWLCHCITLTLENAWLKNVENGEVVARGLYLQGRITQCVDVCSKAMQLKGGNDFPVKTLKILQGKALYQKFIQEQRRLQLSTLTVDMKIVLKEACYKINRQVIELLGKAFDDRLFDDDDETAYMLDRTMMDCVFNANMLGSCHRCYLCRRNLKKIAEVVNTTPGSSQTEKAGRETSHQEQYISDLSPPNVQKGNRSKKAEKLIKSHIIPRAILEQLCGSLSSNKQVILSTKSPIRASEDRLLTPAELAYYMLCPKCEDNLSANGESQFSLKFFRKLYSLTDEHLAEAEQEIDYGPWLYQFCVGLIFRALHWDVDDYSNSNELYAVFRKCRDIVMGWMHTDERSVGNLKISLFISPLSVGHYEQQCGHMNMYLRGGIGEIFGHKDASRTSQLQAHFFVVRFGIVNIAVEFGDFTFKDEFNMFIIKSSGGTYHVPSEKERRRQIPQCIWSQFQEISYSIRSHLWVADPQISRSIKGEQTRQEKPDKVDPFNVGTGIISEGLSNLLKHLSHDDSHDICLLPPEFSLKSTSNSGRIILPKGHTILLHANYVRGEAKGSTFFVAIGSSKKYPINKPYVIWHFYDHQGQSSCSAFFSPEDLSITEFLTSSQTLTMQLLANSSLATARERMPKILKDLLAEKGFSSMASLLQHVKSAVCVGRDIPPMDTKCSKDRKCWYCRSLCQNCCLKSVAYGRIAPGPYGPNQFCSESCQLLSPGMFSTPQVFIISPTTPPPQGVYIHCDPINQQHREIQHIYIRLLNKQNFPCEMEICLCIGDGTDGCPPNRPYVLFYSHHIFHQLFAEFFISVELLAEEPLPHTANEASWDSLLRLNDARAVRKVLEKADVLETTMVQILQLKGNSKPAELVQSSSEWSTVSALH